jgi:anthranilate synthase component 1
MSLPDLPAVRCWYRRIASRAAPLPVFESLYDNEASAFLYESLEAHGGRGRYSFIGSKPRAVFRAWGDRIELTVGEDVHTDRGVPLDALRRLNQLQEDAPPVAPFCGGAVGYLSYDAVRWCEDIPATNPDDLNVPDAHFLFPREVICFDHLEKVVHVLLYQNDGHEQRLDEIRASLDDAHVASARDESRDGRSSAAEPVATSPDDLPELKSNMTQRQFEQMVENAKQYILAGDVFQVVLSQRFEFPVSVPPLEFYRALRITNPSPYMYYLRLGSPPDNNPRASTDAGASDGAGVMPSPPHRSNPGQPGTERGGVGMHIVGSSPEILVKQIGRKIVTRPLAGTRRRGQTAEEDEALARELQADPKERAEHVMLVDLGRNDVGRVCAFNSIELTELLSIERHSKVMHLVSNVEGWLREGLDAYDVFRAVFPAGTLSGAPKVRAMEIIEELEPTRRGVFGGAIGYFSVLGDLDLCIAIRTMVIHGDRGFIQAGAGIVADSVPTLEYQETLNKANGVMQAVRKAQPRRSQPD